MLLRLFEMYEKEAKTLAEKGLISPAYDYCLKTSHTFNLLDARGAISVTERVGYILRVRTLSRLCAEGYLKQREEMGFPLLKNKMINDQCSIINGPQNIDLLINTVASAFIADEYHNGDF